MLPPPTTMPIWTPRPWISATWRAMNAQNAGSTPYGAIAEQRLAGQLEQDPAVAQRRRLAEAALGHSSSPSAYRVKRRTRMFSPIVAICSVIRSRDGALLVAERLVVQADLRVPLLELAVDDLLPDVLGLLLGRLVGQQLGLLGGEVGRRDVLGVDVERRQSGDLDGQVADELLELVGAGHEVGLAVDLDEHADPAAGVDVARHEPFAGLAAGLLRGRGEALLAQDAVALSRSPSASVSARLQSMNPAPVRSRSSLTSSAGMSAMPVRYSCLAAA